MNSDDLFNLLRIHEVLCGLSKLTFPLEPQPEHMTANEIVSIVWLCQDKLNIIINNELAEDDKRSRQERKARSKTNLTLSPIPKAP